MNDCNAVNQVNNWNGGFLNFNQWMRVERYMDKDNVGYSYGSIDLEKKGEIIGNFNTCEEPFNGFILGQYFRTEDGTGATLNQYIGEMYVDTTPARIELCDTSSYSLASHCEIQIPHTQWDGTTIQFTFNQGSFNDGDTAYVFVIDENHDVSNGHEVVIGRPPVCDNDGACVLPEDEFNCPSDCPVEVPPTNIYDLTGDNEVDVEDLVAMVTASDIGLIDFKSDGRINVLDYLVLINNFS
jgi:hypothetical protein